MQNLSASEVLMTFWYLMMFPPLFLIPLLLFTFSESFYYSLATVSFSFQALSKIPALYYHFSRRKWSVSQLLVLCVQEQEMKVYHEHNCIILCAVKTVFFVYSIQHYFKVFLFKRWVMYWSVHLGVHLCLCKIQWSAGYNATGLLSCVTPAVLVSSFIRAALHMITVLAGSV